MRYVVETNANGTYRVVDTTLLRVPAFRATEAEAKIIAFALNAVADGFHLIKWCPVDPPTGMCQDTEGYSGPTEGVAP